MRAAGVEIDEAIARGALGDKVADALDMSIDLIADAGLDPFLATRDIPDTLRSSAAAATLLSDRFGQKKIRRGLCSAAQAQLSAVSQALKGREDSLVAELGRLRHYLAVMGYSMPKQAAPLRVAARSAATSERALRRHGIVSAAPRVRSQIGSIRTELGKACD